MILPIPVFVKDDIGNANAKNYGFWITIRRDCPFFAAVLFQERWESSMKLWAFLIVTALLSGLAVWQEALIWLPFCAVAGVIASRASALPPIQRWLELRGHALEIAVASRFYQRDRVEYEWNEARGMASHYAAFKGQSPNDIALALSRLGFWAMGVALRNARRIRKDMALSEK